MEGIFDEQTYLAKIDDFGIFRNSDVFQVILRSIREDIKTISKRIGVKKLFRNQEDAT